jgi:hypothetical protein
VLVFSLSTMCVCVFFTCSQGHGWLLMVLWLNSHC